MPKSPRTPKSRRSLAGEVGQVVVVGGAFMPSMPVANAEQNGTEAYPIIAAGGVRRLCAPGAAPPSDATAGMLLRDAPAALVGRQAPNEESICRRGEWHQRGAAAGIEVLQSGEVGHRQELRIIGEHLDGPRAAALRPAGQSMSGTKTPH